MYGSIRGNDTEGIFQAMSDLVGMSDESVLMDVGSGLCRPLVHALATGRVGTCIGVEIDSVKCRKAYAFIAMTKQRMRERGLKSLCNDFKVDIVCTGVEHLVLLGPVTHIYSFWEGVPVNARVKLGRLFRESPKAKAICVVQRTVRSKTDIEQTMGNYGFGDVLLVDVRKVSMSGSGRFSAYLFRKRVPNVKLP